MVGANGNGRAPNLGGGIGLLPPGPNGEKWGVDDYLALGWTWNDVRAFVYPMGDVINLKTGEFGPAKWLSSPTTPGSENGGNQTSGELPILTVSEYLSSDPPSYDWIAHGFVARGAVTKLAGAAKEAGKTTWLMNLVAAVLDESPFLGHETKSCNILYLTEQANNIQESLEDGNIGSDAEGLYLLFSHDIYNLAWETVAQRLAAVCEEKDIGLVIVDTMAEFGGLENDEENSAGKVNTTLRPLKQLAKKLNVGVAFTQHHNTEGRGRGSTQFEGDVDIMLDLYPLPDNSDGDHDPNIRLLKGKGRGKVTFHNLLIKFVESGGYKVIQRCS